MAKLTHSLAVLAALGISGAAYAQDAASTVTEEVKDAAAAAADSVMDAAAEAEAEAANAVEAVENAVTGMDGMSGMDGMDGMSGMSGMDGMSGTTDMEGMSGMAGMDGMSGTTDMEGMSGMAGMEGMSGMVGMEAIPPAPITMEKAPDDAPAGTIYPREIHGDWTLRCFKAPEGQPDPCELYQLLKDEQGTEVAFVSMIPVLDSKQVKAGATIVGPLGTLLTEGLRIQVDNGQAQRYDFVVCETEGCMARVGLANADVTRWKRGNVAKIGIASVYGDKVQLPLSLAGFTAGYDSLTTIAEESVAAAKAAAEAKAAEAAQAAEETPAAEAPAEEQPAMQ